MANLSDEVIKPLWFDCKCVLAGRAQRAQIDTAPRKSACGAGAPVGDRLKAKLVSCLSGWFDNRQIVFIKRGAFDGNNGRRGSAGPTGL